MLNDETIWQMAENAYNTFGEDTFWGKHKLSWNDLTPDLRIAWRRTVEKIMKDYDDYKSVSEWVK